jgi:WD40 repeat protein
MTEKRRALIVANSDYLDIAFRRLSAPVEDARELARVLGSPSIGAFEVETLLNERSSAVNHAIEDFFVFSDPKPDDFLLLYFSGHGITDEDGQLYFATSDTQMVRQSVRRVTAVGAEFVNATMRRSRARRQVLVLDCCHSGAFAEAMSVKGQALPGVETHFQGKGRIVLTASTGTQFSFEGQDSGSVRPSVYTRLLVRALETGEADRDCNGQIDLDELHDYLVEQVQAEAPQQTPTKSGYFEGRLYIARAAVVRAAALPAYLQSAIAAAENLTRYGAVYALKELLDDSNPGMALAARQALETLRDKDDSMKVQAAARECLASRQVPQSEAAEVQTPSAAADEIARRAAEAREAETADQRRKEAEEEEERQNLIRQREEAARKAAAVANALRKKKEEQERLARERAEAERKEREEAERQQKQKREKAEAKRIARERAEAESAAQEKAEAERIAGEKAEAEVAREKAEAERAARENADRKRRQREEAERARKNRLAKEVADRLALAGEEADSADDAESSANSEGSVKRMVASWPGWASPRVLLGVLGFVVLIAAVQIALWVAHNHATAPSQSIPASSGTGTEGQEQAGAGTTGSQPGISFPLDPQNPSALPITKVDMEQIGTLTDPDSNLRTESIAFTPGNRRVLAVALALPDFKGNGLIRVWDLSTGQVMRTLQNPGSDRPRDQFETLALSPDGHFAVVTTYAMNKQKPGLLLWDLNTGNLVRDFGDGAGLPEDGEAVTFSPDSSMIAFGDMNGAVRVWNTQTGELIRSVELSHDLAVIASVAFSNDGEVLAVGYRSWNPSVRLWNTRTWTTLRDLHPTQPSYGEALAFSPDGKTLATGHYRGGVYLWDYRTGALLRTLRGKSTEGGGSRTLAFNATGEILAFVCDNTLQVWNPANGKLLSVTNINPRAVAFHSGKVLGTASGQENTVQIWQPHY